MSSSHSLHVKKDRIAGGLTGLLIGDALALPHIGQGAIGSPALSTIDMAPSLTNRQSQAADLPATWSTHGNQALRALAFAMGQGGQDVLDTDRGADSLDQHALSSVLLLSLAHGGSDDDLIMLAVRHAKLASGKTQTQVACAMLCLWVRAELHTKDDAWVYSGQRLRELSGGAGLPKADVDALLESIPHGFDASHVFGILWTACHAMDASVDFASAVRQTVVLEHTTNAAAAVAGGVAGIRYGLYGIPEAWRQQLGGSEQRASMQAALLSRTVEQPRPDAHVTRTSQTHPLRIGTLPLRSGGKIGVTFCPGKKQAAAMTGRWERDLDTDFAVIHAWGATHLVTLVETWELTELDVCDLPQRAAMFGVVWHHAPIRDGGIPDERFDIAWKNMLPQLRDALDRGEGVVVHCKGGLGRAGTVASLLLGTYEKGLSADAIMALVREVRPNAVETVVQEQYLRRTLTSKDNPEGT
jgi:protein-tyrosine phosphatase